MGRANHGIAYDPIHDEFTIPNTLGQAILTFRGGANGDESPIRVIQGPLTQLRNPDTLDVDPIHNEIYVNVAYAVMVFSREANGNVAPIRILKGPADAPITSHWMAEDPIHNLLVLAGVPTGESQYGNRRGSRLYIFNRTDEGNTTPRAVIGGPKSRYRMPAAPIAVYPPKGWILASPGSSRSGGMERLQQSEADTFVGVWSINDNGDVPPKWTIGGPKGAVWKPMGIALDPKHKSIMVSDTGLNGVLTFYFPEIF
jgi:hypothetical protein